MIQKLSPRHCHVGKVWSGVVYVGVGVFEDYSADVSCVSEKTASN